MTSGQSFHTFIYLHVRNRLPFIHSDEPTALALPPAAEVNDQLGLVTAERREHCVQTLLAEPTTGEKERSDDDLDEPITLVST